MSSVKPVLVLACLLYASSSPAQESLTSSIAPQGRASISDTDIQNQDAQEQTQFSTVIIEGIEVIGNEKTSISVITRRMGIQVRDILDDSFVEAARLRLLSTGYFKTVEFSLRRGSQRGRVVLVVEVVERNTIMIDGLYYGTSSVEPFIGGLSLHESNFLGEGVGTGLGFLIGQSRKAADVDFFLPDLSGTPLQLSASGLYVQAEEQISSGSDDPVALKYERYGTRLGIGFEVGAAQRVVIDYRLESIRAERLPNLHPAALRSAPSILFDDSVLSSFGLTYELDTRDDGFVPQLGTHLLFSVETGTQLIGSSYEFTKYLLEFQRAFPIQLNHSLVATFFGGLVQGSTPFFNQFFLRDHMAYISGTAALPRKLQVNYSSETDYDDLLAQLSFDYNIPIQSQGEFLFQTYIFAGIDIAASASLDEYQEDTNGRGTGARFPIAADAGLKFDTLIGRFTFSIAYVTDLIW